METHEQTITIRDIPTSAEGELVKDLVEMAKTNLDGPQPSDEALATAARALVWITTIPEHSPNGTISAELIVGMIAAEIDRPTRAGHPAANA